MFWLLLALRQSPVVPAASRLHPARSERPQAPCCAALLALSEWDQRAKNGGASVHLRASRNLAPTSPFPNGHRPARTRPLQSRHVVRHHQLTYADARLRAQPYSRETSTHLPSPAHRSERIPDAADARACGGQTKPACAHRAPCTVSPNRERSAVCTNTEGRPHRSTYPSGARTSAGQVLGGSPSVCSRCRLRTKPIFHGPNIRGRREFCSRRMHSPDADADYENPGKNMLSGAHRDA